MYEFRFFSGEMMKKLNAMAWKFAKEWLTPAAAHFTFNSSDAQQQELTNIRNYRHLSKFSE